MSTVVAKNLTVQNSAGTASTNISFDGTKLISTQPFDGLGVGQTWQDVTGDRTSGMTYTNTTGKPIIVAASHVVNPWVGCTVVINGTDMHYVQNGGASYANSIGVWVVVPAGATYRLTLANASGAFRSWWELR